MAPGNTYFKWLGNKKINILWDTILYSPYKYSEADIKDMLGFLVDNIYVVFGDQVFQQSVSIPTCAPLLAALFLHSYEAGFLQKLLRDNNKKLAVSFNHAFRYIDDVLSINNNNFHNYVHLIYPDELEIKDTTASEKSASYLDSLLNIDSNGRLTTYLFIYYLLFYVSLKNISLQWRCHHYRWRATKI